MKYEWNWTNLYKEWLRPSFVIRANSEADYQALLNLSFPQGLEVIVCSVPRFSYREWVCFHDKLKTWSEQNSAVDYWLQIAEQIQAQMGEVEAILSRGIESAVNTLEHGLSQYSDIEQFAVMACLYYFAQTNIGARLLFHYLLQRVNSHAQRLQTLFAIYNSLPKRQKEVVIYASQGLTNDEIGEIMFIEPSVVADYLTTIFDKFRAALPNPSNTRGTRYQIIHWLTRLFIQHPYLLANTQD